MDDAEMQQLQRIAAASTSPTAARRSLTALRLVRDDPTGGCAFAPIIRWAKEVWAASYCAAAGDGKEDGVRRARPDPNAYSLDQLEHLWKTARPGATRAWAMVRGPMSAAIMSAKRLGWRFQGPFRLLMANGTPH